MYRFIKIKFRKLTFDQKLNLLISNLQTLFNSLIEDKALHMDRYFAYEMSFLHKTFSEFAAKIEPFTA